MASNEAVQWATLTAAVVSAAAAGVAGVTGYARYRSDTRLPWIEVGRRRDDNWPVITVRNGTGGDRTIYGLGIGFAGMRSWSEVDLQAVRQHQPDRVDGPGLPHTLRSGERARWVLHPAVLGALIKSRRWWHLGPAHVYVEIGDRRLRRTPSRAALRRWAAAGREDLASEPGDSGADSARTKRQPEQ